MKTKAILLLALTSSVLGNFSCGVSSEKSETSSSILGQWKTNCVRFVDYRDDDNTVKEVQMLMSISGDTLSLTKTVYERKFQDENSKTYGNCGHPSAELINEDTVIFLIASTDDQFFKLKRQSFGEKTEHIFSIVGNQLTITGLDVGFSHSFLIFPANQENSHDFGLMFSRVL